MDHEDAFDQLHRLSILEFPNLSADLLRQTRIDNGYRVCGGLEFQAGATSGHAGEWSGAGVVSDVLDERATLIREPALGRNLGPATYLPGLAQVRNPWHVRAGRPCRLLGVRPATLRVPDILARDRIASIWTSQGELAQSTLITTELVRKPGQKLGCRVRWPGAGQIAFQYENASRATCSQRPLPCSREDGRVLVGSTEEDAGFVKQTTEDAINSLSALAAQMVPALAKAPVEKTWAGLRPGTPDGKPCLGRLAAWRNAFLAAGHFRAGIQLSPGTGMICRDLILDRKPAIPLESLRPDRFSAGRNAPAFLS